MDKNIRHLALILIVLGIAGALFVTNGSAKPAQRSNVSEPLPPAVPVAEKEAAARATGEVKDVGSKVKDLEERVRANGSDLAALTELAKIYLQQRNYPLAADTYATALELSPNDNELRSGYATSLLFQGMVGIAEREFRKVVEAEPGNPEWQMNLAVVLSHKNPPDIEEAVKGWQKVVELDQTGVLAERAKGYLVRYQRP